MNMSIQQQKPNSSKKSLIPGSQERLTNILGQADNKVCADCGSRDPKWVSLGFGAVVCIKCSGVHRSLGVHISKVLSVKLDGWTEAQVNTLQDMGGNRAVNSKYEAFIPKDIKKPKPDSSIEERADFIRRKYEKLQFFYSDQNLPCPPSQDKKQYEKQATTGRIGQGFRHSWRKKDPEYKVTRKSISMAGMVEFVGLIKVSVIQGTDLAVRDILTSDPYVILSLGQQSVRTHVVRNSLNPVWNEQLMMSIPRDIPPLKVIVYDKDTFKSDDFMGDAEIDIQPLVVAAKASENSLMREPMQLGKWLASKENTLVNDSIITFADGMVKQAIAISLQNVECGVLDIELECFPLSQ